MESELFFPDETLPPTSQLTEITEITDEILRETNKEWKNKIKDDYQTILEAEINV